MKITGGIQIYDVKFGKSVGGFQGIVTDEEYTPFIFSSFGERYGGVCYFPPVNGMVHVSDIYSKGYGNDNYIRITKLNGDGTTTELQEMYRSDNNNIDFRKVSGGNDKIILSSSDENNRYTVRELYPSGTLSNGGTTYRRFQFRSYEGENILVSHYDNTIRKDGTLLFSNTNPYAANISTNNESRLFAWYDYPLIRLMDYDGNIYWEKHIINDLSIGQNPPLCVTENEVLFQDSGFVSKIDLSGNVTFNVFDTSLVGGQFSLQDSYARDGKIYCRFTSTKIGVLK